MSIPRTTHTWLEPFYDVLEGKTARSLSLGSPTGYLGFFGASGGRQLSTGTAGITGWTGLGSPSGIHWFNGGTGAYYTNSDVVLALKNIGVLKP
jgi:hypothetical protein